MPLLARGPGFGIKKISVMLALVTYFSMMQYSVRSKILSEKKFSCRLFIDVLGETLILCIFRWFQVP